MQRAMNHRTAPVITNKRKREVGDDMADNTSRKAPNGESSGWIELFGAIRRNALGLFSVASPKKVTSSVTNIQANQRRVREETPRLPGAWPATPQYPRRALKSHITSGRDSSSRILSRNLNRDRNDPVYWQDVGNDVGLEPQYRNLPLPSRYPPAPKHKPQRRTRRPAYPEQFIQSSSTNHARNVVTPFDHKISNEKAVRSESPEAAGEDSKDPLADVDLEFAIDEILDVPQFRRSLKLVRKEQELKTRRATSPALRSALQNAYREYQEKKRQEEEEKRKPKLPGKLIVPLPDDLLASLPNLNKVSADKELNKFGRTPVTARDLLTLRADTWLNDEVINSWFWELCDKAKALLSAQMTAKGTPITDEVPRYHAFNTTWYPTMAKPDWRSKVPRWAKRAKIDGLNLLKVHKVLIPIHQGAHWTLLVILPQRRIVRYYDSLGGSATRYLDAARDWIAHELGNAWVDDEWQLVNAESGKQINMSDCGVFASCNALATFYSDFTPEILPTGPMVDAREFMKYVLINGGFKGDYEMTKLHPNFYLETDRGVSSTSNKGKEKAK